MRCVHCDRKIPDDSMFCPYCGQDVEERQSLDELQEQLLRQLSKEVTGELPDPPSWEREKRREYRRERSGRGSKRYVGIIALVLIVMVFLMAGIWIIFTTMDANERRQKQEQAMREKQEEELNNKNDAVDEESRKDEETDDGEEARLAFVGAPEDFGDYYKLPVKEASASSVISQEGADNSAAKVVDGNEKTSWQEGADGDGIGESVHLELEKTYNIKYLSFQLGNWNSMEYYDGNNRPKDLEITVGDVTQTITFPDGKTQYWVEFSKDYLASDIEIVIKDVYKGSQWDDTCIAEIGIYGRGN